MKHFRFIILIFLFAPLILRGQIAKDKCKFLGNVVSSSVPGDFATYWNQVTPENGGKWGSVEASQDNMNWANLDLAYNYAKSNNFPFKQHTFVWGQQQPEWISALSAEQQRDEIEEWIRSFCERYPATDFIDVVNEPLHAVPDYSAALGGNGTTGWDWVVTAFEMAREYCPNAKLILNDYNIINNTGATTQYLALINLLKSKNLIDIIGEQGHFMETTPIETIKSNLDRLHETGLPIHISEYDVNISNDAEQQSKFAEQFPVLWTHQGVKGITLWGYRQGQIWRTDAYLVRMDNTERPSLTWMKAAVNDLPGGSFCLVMDAEDYRMPFHVYPNPSRDGAFTIDSTVPNALIEIVDMRGRKIKQFTIKEAAEITVDLKDNPGMYLIRFLCGNEINTAKVLIE